MKHLTLPVKNFKLTNTKVDFTQCEVLLRKLWKSSMEIFILVTGDGGKIRRNYTPFECSYYILVLPSDLFVSDKGSLLAIISILVILLLHNDIIKVGISLLL